MAVATGQSQGFSGTIESAIYTSQLEAIVTQLTAINQNLTDFNLSNDAQNTAFNTAFAAAFQTGSHLNLGTISNVINALLTEQQVGRSQIARVANGVVAVGAALVEGNDNVGGKIASGLAQLNASQAVQIAQNSKKTAFEQAATQAALERSNLPPVIVPQPDVQNTIESAVNDATIVSAQTKATGFVTTQIDEAIGFGTDVVTNQLGKLDFVQAASLKWSNISASLTGDTPAIDKTQADTNAASADGKSTPLGNTPTISV